MKYGLKYAIFEEKRKKFHFMVTSNVALGHIISKDGIKVDQTKLDLNLKFLSPSNLKERRQLLSHSRFFTRFIKNF